MRQQPTVQNQNNTTCKTDFRSSLHDPQCHRNKHSKLGGLDKISVIKSKGATQSHRKIHTKQSALNGPKKTGEFKSKFATQCQDINLDRNTHVQCTLVLNQFHWYQTIHLCMALSKTNYTHNKHNLYNCLLFTKELPEHK